MHPTFGHLGGGQSLFGQCPNVGCIIQNGASQNLRFLLYQTHISQRPDPDIYVLALWVILCIQACRGLVNQFVGLMWISEYWVSVRQTYEMFQCTGLKFNLQIVWFATKLYTWVAKVATMKGDRAVENLSSRGRFSHKTICLFVLIRFACLHFACQFQPMLWEVYVSSDYGLKKRKPV